MNTECGSNASLDVYLRKKKGENNISIYNYGTLRLILKLCTPIAYFSKTDLTFINCCSSDNLFDFLNRLCRLRGQGSRRSLYTRMPNFLLVLQLHSTYDLFLH